MNKKNLFLAVGLLLSMGAGAQTTYFQTDFELGMPEGMTFYDLDQKTPSTDMQNLGFSVGTPWIVTAPDDESGNHVATSTSWYKTGAKSDDWMILPAVTIGSEKARLTWRSRASDKDYRDGLKVYITEKGTVAPDDFDTTAPVFSVSKENYAWTEREVDLSPYVGKTIYIAFVNDSKDRTMLYVDDLFVGIPSKVSMTLGFGRCLDGYGDVHISGQAFAGGQETVVGYTVGFECDGQTVEQSFEGSLTPGQKVDFTLDKTITLERNRQYSYRAWIKSGDDQTVLTGKFYAIPWRLVCEEVTGTWCQYCVRGIGAMNEMRETHPEGFTGIAIHNSRDNYPDSMAIKGEKYLNWVMSSFGMGGFPNCVINRNTMFAIDPGNIPYYYEQIKKYYTHDVGVMAEATLNPTTGIISCRTNVLFTKTYEDANFRLAYVVVENSVHRTHAESPYGYDQENAYAGGYQGKCYGFENKPSVISADDIWYNDVARAFYPEDEFRGLQNIFPKTINEGDSFNYDYELAMPDNVLKQENTEVVVLLMDKDGIIRNADCVKIEGTGTEGIESQTMPRLESDSFGVYDLQGRRLKKTQKAKGIYIVGGRKVVF